MKKVLTLAVLAACSTFVQAKNFTGVYSGGEVDFTKYSVDIDSSQSLSTNRGTGFSVFGGVGFALTDNLISALEIKYKASSNTKFKVLNQDIKEDGQISISYLQGYSFDSVMPYVKIGYNLTRFNGGPLVGSETARGLDLGFGVKYALTSNFDLGMDFTQHRLKDSEGGAIKGNTFGLSASFRY